MRTILVIGIGAGHPDFLTLQAIEAMRRADVVFLPDKGAEKAGLNAVRLQLLERAVPQGGYRLVEFTVPERRQAATPEYKGSIEDWRSRLEAAYRQLFTEHLGETETGAFLVWGDPALYDGTLGILEGMRASGLALEVRIIPGISAVQALAAAHRIPLNRVGEAVTITTGRRVAAGEADGLSNFVVMLDSHAAWERFAGEEGADIYWGAYLGTADEILVAGRIAEVKDAIAQARAAAQQRHGWIMDTYLIRRPVKD
jgi:precorrin-6A synthase